MQALDVCELQVLLMGGDPGKAGAAPAWRPLMAPPPAQPGGNAAGQLTR